VGWTAVILPIGISFFTFHKISYVVDIYRGTRRAFSDFVGFALYVAFFPQLIAGPIVRFHEISEQLRSRTESLDKFYQGVLRFCWGLVKKTLLANPCGEIADAVFAMDAGSLGTQAAWIGISAYTLQIYFDFSGYTDMALGLGLMFGFKLPENFNRPYSAISITDFWRRWHMSLTNFFRDYLYIPLGGNRLGTVRTYFNLILVFVLCGFWHGARWTFLAWGLYHGALLVMERITGLRNVDTNSYRFLRRLVTLFLIIMGWVFFRAKSLRQASAFLAAMFLPVYQPIPYDLLTVLNGRNLFFLSLAALVVFLPRDFSVSKLLAAETTPVLTAMRGGLVMILLLYSISFIASGSFNPFIYFQF
jgi:alginate O-acetyltransferase complex protein AlgI